MSGETKQDVSGWTTDTLRQHFESQLADLRATLQERYDTQTKATNAAFAAQQAAMHTAFRASQEAVHAALLATKEAIDKANAASEKRFDSVNEFRAQLADQAQTFMPRAETEATHRAMDAKVDDGNQRVAGRLSQLEVNWMSRREVEASVRAAEDKIRITAEMLDRQRENLLSQITANALAIEKANAAGQTIYVLRSEAASNARVIEDKIITAATAAAAADKLAIDAIADLRAQIGDQATKFMPRAEAETRTTANTDRLREIEIRIQSYPSRDETAVALNAADAKFAAGIGSVTEKTASMSDRMAAMELRLSSRLDLSAGKSTGSSTTIAFIFAAVGALAAIIAIVYGLK